MRFKRSPSDSRGSESFDVADVISVTSGDRSMTCGDWLTGGKLETSVPLVSVVVPTRDRTRELRQTLTAILAQQVNLEVLLVEDGSAGVAGAVAARIGDARVRLLRNGGRRGAGATRNVGVAAARGRWLAFCDDDDVWAPGKLAAQLDALTVGGAGWSCTAEITVDADLRIIRHRRLTPESLHLIRSVNLIPGGGSGVVADAGLVRAAGGFDESLSNAEDWDLWIRLAARSELVIVDRPLMAYREWPQSKSINVRGMTTSYDAVLSRSGALPLSPSLAYARGRYLARQKRRAHQRLPSTAAYLTLALRHRSLIDGARAAGALVAPRAMEQTEQRRARGRIPRPWLDEAEAWLAPLRQSTVSRQAAAL